MFTCFSYGIDLAPYVEKPFKQKLSNRDIKNDEEVFHNEGNGIR